MVLCVCPNPAVDTYWWLDDLAKAGVNRILKEENFPGGKGTHVAMAIAELGEEVALLGFWAGNEGLWIKEECDKKNVRCFGTILPEGNNRKCITVRSIKKTIENTEFLGAGPVISQQNYDAFFQEYLQLLNEAEVVVFSGSWPKGAPVDAYGSMIGAANSRVKKAWIDCSGTLLLLSLSHNPYGVHLNKTEAEEIVTNEKAENYFLEFVRELALTNGSEGLYLYNYHTQVHAMCKPEKIYSSVGSGDFLVAGLAIATLKKYSTLKTAGLATAAGGANCMREELGMLYRGDVNELLKKVIIKKIYNDHQKRIKV